MEAAAAAAGDADGDGDRAVDDDEMAWGGASIYTYMVCISYQRCLTY